MTKKETEILKKKFGENLQKLSLLKMSYNCSIDESKISKIEHGQFNISLSTVMELAKGLDVPPKKLFDFEFNFGD